MTRIWRNGQWANLCKLTSEFGLDIESSPDRKEYLGESIARALTEADWYVVLIVDEFEEVYRTSDTNPDTR